MIVLEGPDGAGKTTLLTKLRHELHVGKGPRAATSTGGPVDNLKEWVEKDILTWYHQPMRIYDRYPLISDFVYGPLLRGGMNPGLEEAYRHRTLFAQEALVIFCLPPLEVVKQNVLKEAQMPGVVENIEEIYTAYYELMSQWPTGNFVVYDYTDEGSYNRILQAAFVHLQQKGHRRDVRRPRTN